MDKINCKECVHGDVCKYKYTSTISIKRNYERIKHDTEHPFDVDIYCKLYKKVETNPRNGYFAPNELNTGRPQPYYETYTTDSSEEVE